MTEWSIETVELDKPVLFLRRLIVVDIVSEVHASTVPL